MKKIYKKSISALAALTVTSNMIPSVNVSAVKNENTSNLEQNVSVSSKISDNLASVANKYISFDTNSNSFKLDTKGLLNEVSQSEYEKVLAQISNTNNSIKKAMEDEVNISVVDTEGNEKILKQIFIRGRGVNDIKFYWNFARIFIDAGNLRLAMQIGFSAGSIFAPSNIIKFVCASLNIFSSNINHGIWFDYNYFIGILCGNFGVQ